MWLRLYERARLGHIATKQVIECWDIRGALYRGMPAQGHDPATGSAHVAKQQLYDGSGANNLHSLRLLRPANRVTEGGSAFAPRILDERLHDLHPLFAWHSAHL